MTPPPPGSRARRTSLDSVSFFHGLEPEQRRELESAGRRKMLATGHHLFEQDEPADSFHVVLSGRLRSLRRPPSGGEVVMHFIEPGDIVGEIPVLLGNRYHVTAQALEPSEVFSLPLTEFRRVASAHPEVGLRYMRAMAAKMVRILERLEAQKVMRADQRVANHLLTQTNLMPDVGSALELRSSKKIWAQDLGLQPESLSRALRRMTDSGVIRVEGRRIVILDPDALNTLATGGE